MPPLGETIGDNVPDSVPIGDGTLELRSSSIGELVFVSLTGEVSESGVYTLFSRAGNFGNLKAVVIVGSFFELEGDELFDFRETFVVKTGVVGV